MFDRRSFLKAVGVTAGAGLGATTATGQRATYTTRDTDGADASELVGPNERFVGTWSAAPVPPAQSGLSQTGIENRTLREVVHTSVGGSAVRLRLTNTFGDRPVTLEQVAVGVRESGADVVAGTNTNVTFGGDESTFLPAGAITYSDPVRLDVEPDQDLVVSIYSSDATGPATWHPLALHRTYVSEHGDHTTDATGEHFTDCTGSWFFLNGVDVVRKEKMGTIVAFGDSITDGYASTPGADHTWPDYLARRLVAHESIDRSVVNAGISGNRVLHDSLAGSSFGPNALARLNRDVIAQPGVTDVILLEGINDIGQYPPDVTPDRIIAGLRQIARRVHSHGIRVFAGTLTPTRGTGGGYDTPEAEATREAVNEFIRTTDAFDGVIDFDAAIRDPDRPDRMLPKYDSGDHLHPGDAGYRAMAEAIDLSLFKGDGNA